jgi:hypothetical protein
MEDRATELCMSVRCIGPACLFVSITYSSAKDGLRRVGRSRTVHSVPNRPVGVVAVPLHGAAGGPVQRACTHPG